MITRLFLVTLIGLSGSVTGQDRAGGESGTETNSGPSTIVSRLDSAATRPMQVYDRDWIERSGKFSVAELLRDLPLNSTGSRRAFDEFGKQPEIAGINLRGLGAESTLVLLDGRRLPADPHDGQAVNLLTLPLAMIERIEVLPDGAGAIHGANAVGGVVNLISRRQFDGAEISVGRSESLNRGGELRQASALFGVRSERGRWVVGIGHDRRAALNAVPNPDGSFFDVTNGGSNFVPGNADERFANVAGCQGRGFSLATLSRVGGPTCNYDLWIDRQRDMASENTSVFSMARFDVTHRWSIWMDAGGSRTELASQNEPSRVLGRFGSTLITPGSPNHPATPPEAGGLNPLWADFTSFSDQVLFLDHVFAANGPLTRRETTDSYRLDLGVSGQFGRFDVEAGLGGNQSTLNAVGRNSLSRPSIDEPLNDGRYNLYDIFSTPETVLNGMEATVRSESEWTDRRAWATVRTDLMRLPNGPVQLALGLDWRDERLDISPDPLTIQISEHLLPRLRASSADRETFSAYVEADLPLHARLNANLALRRDDSDDLGDVLNARISTTWAVTDRMDFRASWSRSGNAPEMTQGLQFISSGQLLFPLILSSPALCQLLGIDRDRCNYVVTGRTARNPDLGHEIATQLNLGLSVRLTRNLTVSMDAFDLALRNRARAFDPNLVFRCWLGEARRCPDQAITTFYLGQSRPDEGIGVLVIRGSDGLDHATAYVQSGLVNFGKTETRGLDFQIEGSWSNTLLNLDSMLRATWIDRLQSHPGFDLLGRPGAPEWRGQWFTQAEVGDFAVSWMLDFIGPQTRTSDSSSSVPSWVTHDVQLSWDAPWSATVVLGVDNLSDREPNRSSSFGYSTSLYDDYGRISYLRYTQRF